MNCHFSSSRDFDIGDETDSFGNGRDIFSWNLHLSFISERFAQHVWCEFFLTLTLPRFPPVKFNFLIVSFYVFLDFNLTCFYDVPFVFHHKQSSILGRILYLVKQITIKNKYFNWRFSCMLHNYQLNRLKLHLFMKNNIWRNISIRNKQKTPTSTINLIETEDH